MAPARTQSDSGADVSVWLRHRRNERNDNTHRVRVAILPGQAYLYAFAVRCRIQDGFTGLTLRRQLL